MLHSETLEEKRRALQEKREAHAAWKRDFFSSRPPPEPLGRLHRRSERLRKGEGCGLALRLARELLKKEKASTPPVKDVTCSTSANVEEEDEFLFVDNRRRWVTQLTEELNRRNPHTDVNILTDPSRTVIVSNLHSETVESELQSFANQFGRVTSLRIVRNAKTGKSRRYAFVQFGLAAEAKRAISFSKKKRLKGYLISIDAERGRQVGFLPKRFRSLESYTALSKDDDVKRDSARLKEDAVTVSTKTQSDEDFLNSILNL